MLLAIFAEVTASSRTIPRAILLHDRCRLVHMEPVLAIVAIDLGVAVKITGYLEIAEIVTVKLGQLYCATGPIFKFARGFVSCSALNHFFSDKFSLDYLLLST